MRILVTGHKGYLGEFLLPALKKFGNIEGFSMPYKNNAEWREALDAVCRTRFDVIVHAATERLQRHEQNRPDAERIFASNYYCTKLVAEHAKQQNAKLIFTSTCSSITPFSFYTWAKRCSADLIMAMLEDSCVLNIYTIFGKEGNANNKESPIRKLMTGKLPYCFHPILRDYIHIDDVVRAIVYVIEKDITGEYDLGTGAGVSTKELINIWGQHQPPVIGDDHPEWPAGIHQKLVARPERMLPGYFPQMDVREWLQTQSRNESIIETDEERSDAPLFYWRNS